MRAGPGFNRPRRARGFTLVEVMISSALCAMLILAATTTFVFLLRGERSLANYSEMNAKARKILEQMGRDFRTCGDVPSGGFNSTSVTLSVPTNTSGAAWQSVTWSYNPATGSVSRTVGGIASIYATNVSSFTFSYYNINGVAPSNDVELKQIQLSMRIVRNVASATTSEYVISAQFTLRSKSTTV
jgi:prepilin-type N-terminal cleavage/methylation domain-containing protein